jgi:7,8-dihydroneopterin aldolase/epimerase/oxygenase
VSDRIEVRGLRVLGAHGANPGEQDRPQPFELDLTVEADLTLAELEDELAVAIDYGALTEAARRIVAEEHYHLLEALAGAICAAVLEDPRVAAVTCNLRKVRPPVAADVRSVGVEMTRTRES